MDKVANVKKEVQIRCWSEMELERQRLGLTVAQWCSRENISHSTYYYRLRKVRKSLCEQIPVPVTEIAENKQSGISAIRIISENISVEMTANVPAETVSAVIGALKC